jgi:hypothetical protein
MKDQKHRLPVRNYTLAAKKVIMGMIVLIAFYAACERLMAADKDLLLSPDAISYMKHYKGGYVFSDMDIE